MRKSKYFIGILVFVLCISIASISAFAVGGSKTATLESNKAIAYSGKINEYQCYISGSVTDGPTNGSVYFIAKQKYLGVWYTDTKLTGYVKGDPVGSSTSSFKNTHDWELQLNPSGPNATGYTAKGTIKGINY